MDERIDQRDTENKTFYLIFYEYPSKSIVNYGLVFLFFFQYLFCNKKFFLQVYCPINVNMKEFKAFIDRRRILH